MKNRLPPFVPLLVATLESPTWKALSHGARSLYTALKRRYNQHNNGRVFLSQRNASRELNSHHNEIARWFRELRHYGFIVQTSPGHLGVEGRGKAPRWRLTELGTIGEADGTGQRGFKSPTRDYERWDGSPFVDKIKSRAGISARGVRERPYTTVQQNRPTGSQSVQDMAHIRACRSKPESPHRTISPYTTAAARRAPPASAPHTATRMQPVRLRRHREQLIEESGPSHSAVKHRPRVRLLEDSQ